MAQGIHRLDGGTRLLRIWRRRTRKFWQAVVSALAITGRYSLDLGFSGAASMLLPRYGDS